MLKKLSSFIFLFSGCVSTSDPNPTATAFDRQIAENPKLEEQLRREKKYYLQQENLLRAAGPHNDYTVNTETVSKSAFVEVFPGTAIGYAEYVNQHKLYFTLVCDKNSFLPKYFRRKKIKWIISDSIQGETVTSSKGEVRVYFNESESEKHSSITVITERNSYVFNLSFGELVFELPAEECER